ncbi:YPT31 [Symbiodinium pilosum]|uniref:YPT31 protein n=1 Tax=Symbiodinium pilosum TaxID=2952 RepID=A0A812WAH3_SYMPI|nr:YPT31 [Symbiodinium pilosum]
MVIKTDLCSYTEYRIYPGHGQKFVAKDAKVSFFISAKADSLYHQRIKPVKLRWTQAWRRQNKKGKVEEGGKKKARKAQKFQKAIVGMSLDDLKKKKAMRPELRQAREQAAKEAKAKQQAEKKKAASSKPAVAKGKADKGAKLPKGGGAPAGGAKNFKGKKCQCAAVKNMSCELLRSGDKAIVTFRWCYHAEYVCLGETLLFREGRTKGLGKIVELVDDAFCAGMKVVLIGDSSVGKSALVYRFMNNSLLADPKATVGISFFKQTLMDPLMNQQYPLQIWDTAGQEKFQSVTTHHYRAADGALLVFDIANERSFQNLDKWLAELRENTDPSVVVALVGTKADLSAQRAVSTERAQGYARGNGLLYVETSAYWNKYEGGEKDLAVGVEQIFLRLVRGIIQTQKELGRNPARLDMSGYPEAINLEEEGRRRDSDCAC